MEQSNISSVSRWLVFDKFDFSFKLTDSDGMPCENLASGLNSKPNYAEMTQIAYTDKDDKCYLSLDGENFFIIYNALGQTPCSEESSSGTLLPIRKSSGEYFFNNSGNILCAYRNRGLFFVPIKDETADNIILSSNPKEFERISPTQLKNLHKKSFENTVAQNSEQLCHDNPESDFANRSLLKQALRHPLCRNRVIFRKKSWLSKKSSFDYAFAPGEFHSFGHLVYSEIKGSENEAIVPVVYVNKDGRERSSFAGKQFYLKRFLDDNCHEFSNIKEDEEHEIIRFLDENGDFLTNPKDGKILCAYKDECLFLIPKKDDSSLNFDSNTWDYVPFLHTKALDAVQKFDLASGNDKKSEPDIHSKYINFSDFNHIKSGMSNNRNSQMPFTNTMHSYKINFQ